MNQRFEPDSLEAIAAQAANGEPIALQGDIHVSRPQVHEEREIALVKLGAFLYDRYPFSETGVSVAQHEHQIALRLMVSYGDVTTHVDAIVFEPKMDKRNTTMVGWNISLPEHPGLTLSQREFIRSVLSELNVHLPDSTTTGLANPSQRIDRMTVLLAKLGVPNAIDDLYDRYLKGEEAASSLLRKDRRVREQVFRHALHRGDEPRLFETLAKFQQDGLLSLNQDVLLHTRSPQLDRAIYDFMVSQSREKLAALLEANPSLLSHRTGRARHNESRYPESEMQRFLPAEPLTESVGYLHARLGWWGDATSPEYLAGYLAAFPTETSRSYRRPLEAKWLCESALAHGRLGSLLETAPQIIEALDRSHAATLREDPRMVSQVDDVIGQIGVAKATPILPLSEAARLLPQGALSAFLAAEHSDPGLAQAIVQAGRPELFAALGEQLSLVERNAYLGFTQVPATFGAEMMRLAREVLALLDPSPSTTEITEPLYASISRAWSAIGVGKNWDFIFRARQAIPRGGLFAETAGCLLELDRLGFSGASSQLAILKNFFTLDSSPLISTIAEDIRSGRPEVFTSRRSPIDSGARLVVASLRDAPQYHKAVEEAVFGALLQSLQHGATIDIGKVLVQAIDTMESHGALTPLVSFGCMSGLAKFLRYDSVRPAIMTDATFAALKRLAPSARDYLEQTTLGSESRAYVRSTGIYALQEFDRVRPGTLSDEYIAWSRVPDA